MAFAPISVLSRGFGYTISQTGTLLSTFTPYIVLAIAGFVITSSVAGEVGPDGQLSLSSGAEFLLLIVNGAGNIALLWGIARWMRSVFEYTTGTTTPRTEARRCDLRYIMLSLLYTVGFGMIVALGSALSFLFLLLFLGVAIYITVRLSFAFAGFAIDPEYTIKQGWELSQGHVPRLLLIEIVPPLLLVVPLAILLGAFTGFDLEAIEALLGAGGAAAWLFMLLNLAITLLITGGVGGALMLAFLQVSGGAQQQGPGG